MPAPKTNGAGLREPAPATSAICPLVTRLARPEEEHVRPNFEADLHEHGLPRAIRSDNGPPFASPGVGGLSRLAVWWIKLGIRPERIVAGKPQQNGRHERVHRTLNQETAMPPADSLPA